MMDNERDHFETRVVQAGRRREWTQGLVNPPVYRASTILFDNVAAFRNPQIWVASIMAAKPREYVKATQTILWGGDTPSAVWLPISKD